MIHARNSCTKLTRAFQSGKNLRGLSRTATRSLSYSAYEYPLATEAPTVTKTTAAEVRKRPRSRSSTRLASEDPFDDQQSLSDYEVQDIREAQKQFLDTSLNSSSSITSNVPSHIPPNVSADQLEVPETLITSLSNGVRVVSQETYGQASTVGVVSQLGSRSEKINCVTNLLEVLAFGSTSKFHGSQVSNFLQDWGGQRFVSTGREQSIHCIDLLRPNVEKAMELLQQVLLEPVFLPEEVLEGVQTLHFQALEMPPELVLSGALQQAAYGTDQELGKPHFFVPESEALLTSNAVHQVWTEHFIGNPEGLVIAGAGVRHEFLVNKSEELFGHLKQSAAQSTNPSTYRGGEHKIPFDTKDEFIRVGVGLEVGGWHSDDLVATCVLQTLLGGGSSFSAGGPGKGMYSRLYRSILNQYIWAESAEAFTAFHEESGLWGISGSTLPSNARDMIQVFTAHLARLAVELVSDEELDRARNMLKCNVLTQLESRLVLFEDMGRQVLTYGKRECMHDTCARIEAVTAEDLRQVAVKALQKPPTLAAVGADLKHVPHHHEVVSWLS